MNHELPDWEKVISAQYVLQQNFPECILVGGTAASLHSGHRVSFDGNHIMPDLKDRYDEILLELEKQAGWTTNRIYRPVLILGQLNGVETGIRQLMREKPLETTVIRGIKVPSKEEMLRIKAYLIIKRNVLRDYIDFVALADTLGKDNLLKAFENFDDYYPQHNNESITRQLCKQLAEPKPFDLTGDDLSRYKQLVPKYHSWKTIEQLCCDYGVTLLEYKLK
ncbi:MAG: hypothetical protein AB1765_11450 [Candidatus Hydrogenedentota bacterium]